MSDNVAPLCRLCWESDMSTSAGWILLPVHVVAGGHLLATRVTCDRRHDDGPRAPGAAPTRPAPGALAAGSQVSPSRSTTDGPSDTHQIRRLSVAQRVSSRRLESWSLRRTDETCVSTVLSE